MPRKDIYKDAKPFTKNDPRINRKGAPRKIPMLDEALIKTLTETELTAILKALIKKAKSGEVRAIQELFDRAYGKSKQFIDHGGLPQPINITVANPETGKEISNLIENVSKLN